LNTGVNRNSVSLVFLFGNEIYIRSRRLVAERKYRLLKAIGDVIMSISLVRVHYSLSKLHALLMTHYSSLLNSSRPTCESLWALCWYTIESSIGLNAGRTELRLTEPLAASAGTLSRPASGPFTQNPFGILPRERYLRRFIMRSRGRYGTHSGLHWSPERQASAALSASLQS
jgi:hypothetical protein